MPKSSNEPTKHLLKKSNTSSKFEEFDDPLQGWIYEHSQFLVSSLIAELSSCKHMGAFFNNHNGRLFYKDIKEFDEIVLDCYLIRMSNNPNIPENLHQVELRGRAAYILFNHKLYYSNHYSQVYPVGLEEKKLAASIALFPQEIDSLIVADNNVLEELEHLAPHKAHDIIDDFGDAVLTLLKMDKADEIYDCTRQLIDHFFLPIEKSEAWQIFWKDQKDKIRKVVWIRDLIAGAFFYKMLMFWSNKWTKLGHWNETTKLYTDIIKQVCNLPLKKPFLKECKLLLRQEIKKRLSYMDGVNDWTESDKVNHLCEIFKHVYYKLLIPESSEIIRRELRESKGIREKVLSTSELDIPDSRLENSNQGRQKGLSFSFLAPKQVTKRNLSSSEHSNETLSDMEASNQTTTTTTLNLSTEKVMITDDQANSSTTSSCEKTLLPRKLKNRAPIPTALGLHFPVTLEEGDLSANPSVSWTNRETPRVIRLSKESKEEQKAKKDYCINLSGKAIPATRIGEMILENQSFLFFAVPNPNSSKLHHEEDSYEFK